MVARIRQGILRRIAGCKIGKIQRREKICTYELGIHNPGGGVLSKDSCVVETGRAGDIGKVDQRTIAIDPIELGEEISLKRLSAKRGQAPQQQ